MAPFPSSEGIWIRLAAVRRGAWLVTIHEWAMDLGSLFWLDLGQLSAVGLGSLSLWRMALDTSCGGWFYSPPVFYGYPGYPVRPRRRSPRGVHPPQPIYRPVTAVFRSPGRQDRHRAHASARSKGKTPLNLERGVFSNVGMKGLSETGHTRRARAKMAGVEVTAARWSKRQPCGHRAAIARFEEPWLKATPEFVASRR